MLIIKEETYKMQTAEKFTTNELSLEELLEKNNKLERIAELAAQLLETYKDEFASYNEKQYVIDKLSEGVLEYEMFLDR
jgi:ribosomal protein S17E